MLRGTHALDSAGALGHHETGPEADLYLEGHDQHRGWFHSSLLIACALEGRAPYRGLLTHGFTVDSQGRKMSKSLGNGIEPQVVSSKLGAEIIRLWVAASDYSGDIAGDDKILARVVDGYRRIRNTLRFLLANTSDFDAATQAVPLERLLEIDRYALARAAELQAEILEHFTAYEFHPVVAKLQLYCSEDLGGFYLDVLKDRLYTTAPDSAGAAQRADRAVVDHACDAALDGAVPELHRRGSLAGARARPLGVDLHRDLQRHHRLDRRCAAGQMDADARDPRGRQQGHRGAACGRRGGLVAAGRVEHHRGERRPCAAGRPGRRPEVRHHHLGGRAARRQCAGHRGACRRRPPSASAAGTGATMSAPMPRTRRSVRRCVANLYGAGESRRVA